MSRYVKPIPISTQRAGTNLAKCLKILAARAGKNLEEFVIHEAEIVLRDIINNSPVYTGASAGVDGPHAYRVHYPSHPAYKYRHNIGNYFNGGESGWQLHFRKINQYAGQAVISNPMWDKYLKFVNAGVVPTNSAGFVNVAWQAHLARTRRAVR